MSNHEPKAPPSKGTLDGIRIVDLTRLYPGPLATMLLAEMGAEVIKIEDPKNPDPMRNYPPFHGEHSAGYLAVNRSKKNLALSIEDPQGAEIFLQLVEKSDVVIEQFRPGHLQNVGCDYATAQNRNPNIIFVSLTGYGQTGPYAEHPGHDLNYQGYSGLLSINGTPQTGPIAPGAQFSDTAGGAYMAVTACLSALLARNRHQGGQHVDVSMVDCSLPLISLQMAHFWAMGQSPGLGAGILSGLLPCYGVYQCKDNKYIALAALETKFWHRFCSMVEKPEWIDAQYDFGPRAQELKADMDQLFRSDDRKVWVSRGKAHQTCITPILELDELESDEHLQHRHMFVEHDHPDVGKVRGIAPPLKFSATPCLVRNAPSRLGAHTLEILNGLALPQETIRELKKRNVICT